MDQIQQSVDKMMVMMMMMMMVLFSPPVCSSPLTTVESVCVHTFCGAGRECVSTDRGEPVCRCLQQCDVSVNWVCGSNGKSYRNHCELHKDACVTHTKIHTQHRGLCLDKTNEVDVSPMVCFLSDRDWLRDKVMLWLESNMLSLNVSSSSDLLHTYFKMYDDGDSHLDSEEFLLFLNHNETALNLTFSHTLETNLLLRSLCVDALIQLSDENSDWKLSLTEFINCLSPTYHPPERKCALEDGVFEDGAETQKQCNKCVCACGNWVCTALTCNGERGLYDANDDDDDDDGGEEEEMTEEEWSRRITQLNALHHLSV